MRHRAHAGCYEQKGLTVFRATGRQRSCHHASVTVRWLHICPLRRHRTAGAVFLIITDSDSQRLLLSTVSGALQHIAAFRPEGAQRRLVPLAQLLDGIILFHRHTINGITCDVTTSDVAADVDPVTIAGGVAADLAAVHGTIDIHTRTGAVGPVAVHGGVVQDAVAADVDVDAVAGGVPRDVTVGDVAGDVDPVTIAGGIPGDGAVGIAGQVTGNVQLMRWVARKILQRRYKNREVIIYSR